MKTRANWLLVPIVALGLGACNKKEEVKAPEPPAAVAEAPTKVETPAVTPAPEVKVPKIGVAERAAKLGFAKHLPQDTEVVLSFYNGTKIADRVKSSKLWTLVQSQMGMGGGMMVPDGEPMEEPEEMEVPEAEQEPVNPDT